MFWLKKKKEQIIHWMKENADRPRVYFFVGAIGFFESIFFPIPTDVIYMPIILAKPKTWWRHALWASVGSVLGAIVAYFLGIYLAEEVVIPLVELYNVQAEFAHVQTALQDQVWSTTIIAAFTPFPFKVITLAAGIVSAPFVAFLLASIIGRTARFFLTAYLGRFASKHVKYLNIIGWVTLIVSAAIIYLVSKQYTS